MARLSLRLADEQDYDILFSSSAVKDSKRIQEFIQKVLMNALKIEDDQYNGQSINELSLGRNRPEHQYQSTNNSE
jgi:mRNA-degrading endonuclease RelE of RelBE toxin-antitoxin system